MEVSKVTLEDRVDLSKMSESEYKALMSLIGTMMWQIRKSEGKSMGDARRQAADEVASKLAPPVTGKELEQAIGQARQRLFGDKRAEGVRLAKVRREAEKAARKEEAERLRKAVELEDRKAAERFETVRVSKTVSVKPAGSRRKANGIVERFDVPIEMTGYLDKSPRTTAVDQYRLWVERNDWVPLDAVLAHFMGKTSEALAFARSKLVKEGYSFEKNGKLWKVIGRPGERKYTEEDVQEIVGNLLAKLKGRG